MSKYKDFEELRDQPILLFPNTKYEVRYVDKDHVWINGRQFISLKRVGEMIKEKHMTNADRLRAMTDEKLAEWIYKVQDEDALRKENFLQPLSKSWWLDWLKQEYKE